MMCLKKIDDDKIENYLCTIIICECPFGGDLSICKKDDKKLQLPFGHDECIFWQFIFTGSAWQGTKGEQAIIPKDEGFGIMVSTSQSCELGFGLKLTLEELNCINSFR